MEHNQSLVSVESTGRTVDIKGRWIWTPEPMDNAEKTHCFFRRRFMRDDVGEDAQLRISAGSRYIAWLNGRIISRGPCRGLTDHYHYETIDLDEFLVDGENILAVEVCWYGEYTPVAEVHLYPGLWIMMGNEDNPGRILSDDSWRVLKSKGHTPHPRGLMDVLKELGGEHYTVVDPCEWVDFRDIPENWRTLNFDDSDWPAPQVGSLAAGRYQPQFLTTMGHELISRSIPMLEESPMEPAGIAEFGNLILTDDIEKKRGLFGELNPVDESIPEFWKEGQVWELSEPGTHYAVVNMGELTTGYPTLTVEAPAGTVVELRYAEALSRNSKKDVRDDPAGAVEGYFDTFVCREGVTHIEPFVWRTFRFFRLAVHHPDGPVKIKLSCTYTAYPFEQKGWFESSHPLHATLWDVSWRTVRLCAHEHYEDCPYYEQVQYIGDTRLQALVSYMVAGDFRLANQALHQFASSRRSDGIISSRTPIVSSRPQIIPTFSLIWVSFLEDYFRYSGELKIVKHLWGYVESVLHWFEVFVGENGVAENIPYWVFADWSYPRPDWRDPKDSEWPYICGSEGELNMRWLGALQAAARLAEAQGLSEKAAYYHDRAEGLKEAIYKTFWLEKEGLFADMPDGRLAAEHPSILGILYDVVDSKTGRDIIQRLEERDDLGRTTIYYSYYTFQAYRKVGVYQKVWEDCLYNWTSQLERHATTWFEAPEPTRSDCHAWGSWIMCEMLTEILGVKPAKPGFEEVIIEPHTLDLDFARGGIPTVRGLIEVAWEKKGDQLQCDITLPSETEGRFIAPDGSSQPLKSGSQTIMC